MTINISEIPEEVIEALWIAVRKSLGEVQKNVDLMYSSLDEKGYISEIDIDVTIKHLKIMLPSCRFLNQVKGKIQDKLEEPDPDDLY